MKKYFEHQLEKLRLHLTRRVNAGEFTATEIAQRIGLAQASISNFVNGRRRLGWETADALVDTLDLNYQSLIDDSAVSYKPRGEPIPVVRHTAAITIPLITRDHILRLSGLTTDSFRNLPSRPTPQREAWTRFVAIIVTRGQAKFMDPILSDGAMLIIDRHAQQLETNPHGRPHLCAVNRGGFLGIGYVEIRPTEIALRPPRLETEQQYVPIDAERGAAPLIVGRVRGIWMRVD